jgi:hypothetical protein
MVISMGKNRKHKPTETTSTKITVRVFRKEKRELINASSIKEAIQIVREQQQISFTQTVKIELEDDIVYNSEDHGEIETWENEWRRAKRRMSVDATEYDCPHNMAGCVKDDLCLPCQMDHAQRLESTTPGVVGND